MEKAILINGCAKNPDQIRGQGGGHAGSVVQYADDITAYAQDKIANIAGAHLQRYIDTIVNYLNNIQLKLSPTKCGVMLITSWAGESKRCPTITIDGTAVKTSDNLKILGVTINSSLTFGAHIANLAASAKNRTNAIRALTSTTFGLQKEELVSTYKTLVRSVFDYACPAWGPHVSATNWEKLQVQQNKGLRIATGCVLKSKVDHLHQETKLLKVKQHCDLLTAQFGAAAKTEQHPCHEVVTSGPKPGERPNRPKSHIRNVYHDCMAHFELADADDQPRASRQKSLHTAFVGEAIEQAENNKLLNEKPPDISKEERGLDRATRVRLAQLRSGHRSTLASFRNMLDPTIPANCRKCGIEDETVAHAISCIAGINDPTILWLEPRRAAEMTTEL